MVKSTEPLQRRIQAVVDAQGEALRMACGYAAVEFALSDNPKVSSPRRWSHWRTALYISCRVILYAVYAPPGTKWCRGRDKRGL